ncbi:DNA-binding protein HU-alpha [Buchnera aphidicola str. Ak (Acyrthosiphon kondoi)]|uniref:DNA-binding protein HU-alpha n=1 Tax=Buchnera aphidicola str. Ak (Acyrthosiphon kondoi) TaxID=1005090 RepID=G2LMB6_9GAMM|nr:HU family DNA-binding protein [Buchnera aphidicola]AEO08404.1 DNA-binding protein HU-alpha [Buchnera aphidicola str. Ak (Acyrthosiphon kondoi)]WAI18239.1 MAG: HU family DNA-binding protein [Buchnera aphidicola (Acyrthosiphon caraganae)]
MNKTQLINVISKKSNLSKIQAKLTLETTLSTIIDSLKKGESVQIVGFGTFKVNLRSSRTGRNPQTGQEIHIPATKVPSFTSGKTLKNAIK